MATIAIADIHGNLPALDDLLKQILWESAAGDTVVFDSSRICGLFHQNPDDIFSHGGVDVRIASLQEQGRDAIIWSAASFPSGYEGAETTPDRGLRPNSSFKGCRLVS